MTQAERLAHRVTIHFAQRYQVIALTQAIVDQAGLQAHPLRAADAIHLACALTIRRITQEQGLPPPSFVVADTAFAAATAEGFVVDNPLQHPEPGTGACGTAPEGHHASTRARHGVRGDLPGSLSGACPSG